MKIKINGIYINYEKFGEGKPLIMVHGNGENLAIFQESIEILKEKFCVYAIDSRGHGLSSPVAEIHYEEMMEDVYEFIMELEIEKPVYYGFSDGGIVGLMLAINYPDLLDTLIVSGANINPEGIKGGWLKLMSLSNSIALKKSPMYELMLNEPNIPIEDLWKIQVKTYITAGSRDMIREEHTRKIAAAIPNCQLDIFKHESHGSYIACSDKIGKYILKVLG